MVIFPSAPLVQAQALDRVPLKVNRLHQFQSSLALPELPQVIRVLKVSPVPRSIAIPRDSTVVPD